MSELPEPRASGRSARHRATAPLTVRSRPFSVPTALRRRFRLFVAILGTILLIGAIVTALLPRRYVATAEVVLDTDGGAASPRSAAAAAASAATELRILTSREMARAVGTALRLGADGGLRQELGDTAPGADGTPSRRILDYLQAGLGVDPLNGTYSLAISFTAADPQRAARIANGYAREYSAGRLAGAAGERSVLDRPAARLISAAEPPLAAESPRPLLDMALAALFGIGAATIAALVIEWRFTGLTSSSDVEERLGLHHLGSVPTLASTFPGARSPLDAIVDAPLSAFAEAFRVVLMTIRSVGGRDTQVIAITSALPNEGKTTVAACLARTAALTRDPVILIDCDTRRRDTSALFPIPARHPGLAHVLRYEATLDEALIRDEASGAWVLPMTGPPTDITDLLDGQPMAALLEELRPRFKRIVIDTAPVLPITATRALAALADLVVLVVRWRVTTDHAVKAALRLLPDQDVRIGGVVLSQIDMTRTGQYSHDDPAFYYKQYSKYYS